MKLIFNQLRRITSFLQCIHSVADESSQLASLTRFVSYGLSLSPDAGLVSQAELDS